MTPTTPSIASLDESSQQIIPGSDSLDSTNTSQQVQVGSFPPVLSFSQPLARQPSQVSSASTAPTVPASYTGYDISPEASADPRAPSQSSDNHDGSQPINIEYALTSQNSNASLAGPGDSQQSSQESSQQRRLHH